MLLNESIMRRMKPIIIVIDSRGKGLDKTIEERLKGYDAIKPHKCGMPYGFFKEPYSPNLDKLSLFSKEIGCS